MSKPRRACIFVPAERVFGAVGDDRAGHERGLRGKLILGLAFAQPRVEIAVGLGFAIHQIIAKFSDQRRPFGFRQRVRPHITKRHIMPRVIQRAQRFFAVRTGGQAVEDHEVALQKFAPRPE